MQSPRQKKTLSANLEAGVNVECLMEDDDFSAKVTRGELEEMCAPMRAKMEAVLAAVKAEMGVTVDQIDFVEMVGGAHRVPFIKALCAEAFAGKELSFTMNAEESVCRGAALQAAMLSPLFKVRDFKVEDSTPFGISVGWKGSSADAAAPADDTACTEEDGDMRMTGNDGDYKTAVVFPAGSMMNLIKMLTFYRKEAFDITAEYVDPSKLSPGTSKELGVYRIELPTQSEAKKVKVKAKLTVHGTFQVESAQLVEEEEYTETIKEKRELPPDEPTPAATEPDAAAAATDAEPPKEGDEAKPEEKKEPEKKYEWVDVQKQKRRTKRTDLDISVSCRPGLTENEIQKLMDEETAMQTEMKDIIETNERRNDLESYVFNMRDKIVEGNEYGEFISSGDRDRFSTDLTKAEDWLYDNYEGTKIQFIEKLDELKQIGDAVAWRFKEAGMRGDWITAVTGTIANYRSAAENPGDKYGHIAAEKLGEIITICTDAERWLTDMKAKQGKVPKFERPVLICAEMEKKNQELAKRADEILKEPKPAPPKEEEKKPEAGKEPEADGPADADKPNDSASGPQNMDVD